MLLLLQVCQTARSTADPDLAQRLVDLLQNASTVTVGARGIAYSCLLDVLTQRGEYAEGIKALKQGLANGISIEDVNRTALKRLKEGLEATTDQTFPYDIPKKVNPSSQGQSKAAAAAKTKTAATEVDSYCPSPEPEVMTSTAIVAI